MSLNKTILLAFTFFALAVPAASAGPLVCLGSGCPGAVGLCLDDPGVEDVVAFAECAGAPHVDCPAVRYEIAADPVVVGFGPCGGYDVSVGGERVLP